MTPNAPKPIAGAGYAQRVQAGILETRQPRPAAWIAALAAIASAAIALTLIAVQPASAESVQPILREGVISDPSDVDWFVLFALAGETYAISLERRTLAAGRVSVWRPAQGDAGARMVARSSGLDAPLIWTATESGAWRAQVSGLQGATGSYRLHIRSLNDAVGADLPTAKLSAFDDEGVLIERSAIDGPGDADWFAFPVASGNRYVIWSVLGSVGGLRGSLRPPDASSFTELQSRPGLIGGQFEPDRDGMAVLAVRASLAWQVGSYAVGVTRYGSNPDPPISLPPRPVSHLQIERIAAAVVDGQAEFRFRGQWGPIRPNSGLRVWIDTDPGADGEDEWEYLLRSNDGRQARLWSFAEDAWIDSSRVGARGFDTLAMRWSGRTADQRIRWQASVRNTDGTWTVSRPRLLELPHPRPALPPPWFVRIKTGSEDPRWRRQLAAAGVVPDPPDDAIVVVLDPGHGLDSGALDNGVQEAASNLDFALRIEPLLEARGITVVLTRRTAGTAYLNLDRAFLRGDLHARAELAHLADADLFVSIHSNANHNVPSNGLEAWYLPGWSGDQANLRLSQLLIARVQTALAAYGYPTTTTVYDSSCWEVINDTCDPIYILAPFLLMDADAARRFGFNPSDLGLSEDPWGEASNPWLWRSDLTEGEPPIDLINPQTQSGPGRIVRGNLMPTTLLELLYVTHERDAAILRDPGAREVIAGAIADGILEFLGLE